MPMPAFHPGWPCTRPGTATATRPPRRIAHGPREIEGAVRTGLSRRPELRFCVHEGGEAFVEGVLLDAEGRNAATLAWSVQLRDMVPLAASTATTARSSTLPGLGKRVGEQAPGNACQIPERNFHHLRAAEFPETLCCFSEDCLYPHPSYVPGTPKVEFRGRQELLAGFHTSGETSAHQIIVTSVQARARLLHRGCCRRNPRRRIVRVQHVPRQRRADPALRWFLLCASSPAAERLT